jgi:copper chaperone CopZ
MIPMSNVVQVFPGDQRRASMTTASTDPETILVKGMTCSHCVQSVTTALTKLGGITDVRVDLASGRVSYQSAQAVQRERVAEAIQQAGFELQ